jgi:hypothetical protein
MNGAELAVLISAALAGFAGLITAVATSRTAATKTQIESLTVTITTLQTENARQNRHIAEQDAKIDHLQNELDERDGSLSQVKAWAAMLVQQVVMLGGVPCPMPEKEKTKPRNV